MLDDHVMTDTDTNTATQPTVLGRRAIVHLADDLGLRRLDVDDTYWAHTSEQPELGAGRILSVFEYDQSWTWWERHPVGDELLYTISGEIDLHLDDGVTIGVVHVGAGQSAIVPEGAWHRASMSVASRLLFVTPMPARTEHRPC
jgi:quercetin dioxygenase-like cupin family protein